MPIILIATAPALALLARRTTWRAERKHATLTPIVEVNPFQSSGADFKSDRTGLDAIEASNRSDASIRPSRRF